MGAQALSRDEWREQPTSPDIHRELPMLRLYVHDKLERAQRVSDDAWVPVPLIPEEEIDHLLELVEGM